MREGDTVMNSVYGHPVTATVRVNGNEIILDWCYVDTGEKADWDKPRPCAKCGGLPTAEGHDPCLGTLPGVRNACCGHGDKYCGYIQFENGTVMRFPELDVKK